MTADDFEDFYQLVKREYSVSDTMMAKVLGCSRPSLNKWRKQGAPLYIGLACTAVINGLDPWTRHRSSPPPDQVS
jgi:hypothetical protein